VTSDESRGRRSQVTSQTTADGGQISAILPFPGQHHTVSHGQADIFNSRVGLDQTVKGNDGVVICVVGMQNFAAPQDVVGDNQAAWLGELLDCSIDESVLKFESSTRQIQAKDLFNR